MTPVTGLAPASHDSLEGIPDPSETLQVFGHDEIADALLRAHASGKLHHAIILAGPRGIGKATFAYHAARFLIEAQAGGGTRDALRKANAQSPHFRQVAQRAHHSVLSIGRPLGDSGTFKTQITVDEVRRIGSFVSTRAHDGGWRTIIIDGAEDMNRNAANALLKSLEEPPPRTLFLLVAHQVTRLLPTIRSRCQVMAMRPLSPELMMHAIGALPVSIPEAGAEREQWLQSSGGSVRQAILLAEFGGNDISAALRQTFGSNEFDPRAASALASSLTGKAMDVQFALFCDMLRERLSEAARRGAAAGVPASAARVADALTDYEQDLAETNIYNLDRKQFVMAALARAHRVLVRMPTG
jgi:DNA polymerase-3 subunit delta'